jgi:4-diphosphocytidyl-2-C-methyl-D-erythritol kinase
MPMISERAPAKINLTLEVIGKRPDGYHEIASLVAFADFGDVITLDTSKPLKTEVSGPFGGGIAGQNLIDVTLRKISDVNPGLALGAVHLDKRLPIAAGIGGGSADAAAVLRAVRRANPSYGDHIDWFAIAKSLGADVPVCFLNSAAWMTGIGDVLEAAGSLPPLDAVLVNPLLPMPPDKTAQVFRGLGARALDPSRQGQRRPNPGPFGSAAGLIDYMISRGNDLSAPAARAVTVIDVMKKALIEAEGCAYAAVSGAGPTCFGIYGDADAAAQKIAAAHPDWWVKRVKLGSPVSVSG